MTHRFIVAVTELSSEDHNKFVKFAREKGMGFWHWVPGCWLLTDVSEKVTAVEIRDFLHDLGSVNKRCIVIEIEKEKTWAGFGPNKPPQDMFKWIRETWRES